MRYAVILGILLISIPLVLRAASPEPFPDAASYSQLRTSQLNGYDSLYSQPYTRTLSDMAFSLLNAQVLLVILAAASLILLSLYFDDELFILLIATSPAFLTTFTTAGPASIAMFFIALGSVLIKHKQYWSVILVPVCFSLDFSLGILATVTFIVVSLVADLPFISLGTSFFALISGTLFGLLSPHFSLGFSVASFSGLLGVFGASDGITIFLFFLGVIGFLVQWAEKRKASQLVMLLAIPISLFFEHGLVIMAVFLAFYASKAVRYLWERHWNFEELKSITFILIACGILFSAIIVEKSRATLDENRIDVIRFATAAYPKGAPVAADPELVPLLAYHGYPAAVPDLPKDPSFVASNLRSQGFAVFATKTSYQYPYSYQKTGGYTVYELPQY